MGFDRQDFVNRSLRGLAAQGWRQAVDVNKDGDGTACRYRTPDGSGCGIGVVLGPHYDPEIEETSLTSAEAGGRNGGGAGILQRCLDGALPGWRDRHEDVVFLESWREVHDGSYKPEDMRTSYVEFVRAHELTWPEDV